MEASQSHLYPNIDISVWTRSCVQEIKTPIEGKVTGIIPLWLRGSLLRNGPGSTSVGPTKFNHLFDCSALLHRFAIQDGRVTYQCQFLRSNTWKKNRVANRIVVNEFATSAVPDPCHTIFDRMSSFFNIGETMTDNAVVSVYPFGDQVYALSEVPFMLRIDSETLETLERKSLIDSVVVNHTSHPHVMRNGDVYNVGVSTRKGRIRHVVVKFPFVEKGDMFEGAQIVGSMAPRWSLNPAYMHSFGITENYFVIVEQPLSISLGKFVCNQFTNNPIVSCLNWNPEYDTHITLINRKTGKEEKRYITETLFFVHIINCFEEEGYLNVDLCAYKDAKIIDGMYLEALENMQSNPNYADWFRSRAKRIQLPLLSPNLTRVAARQISDVGCEMPRINYSLCNGKAYRYFYAISSDVDSERPGSLIKVDTWNGQVTSWAEDHSFCSEPVFVPAPDAEDEDAGVLLSAILWNHEDTRVTLIVLDGQTMVELARVDFHTPSPVPKDLHGWFISENV
ncbi:carotenoid isomerooxygenase-like [Pectinophora gossypiella]|uniref:carotenoid isomerooxygenase-like n=1 Tax=Pectinophora gossypiella TaxID=13191 RepID=UPI00214E7D75|nr:carotenoid isomerooxygenase-like [Pectinophora gossypiella]